MKKIISRLLISLFTIVLLIILAELGIRKFRPQVTYSQNVEDSVNCYGKSDYAVFTLGRDFTCRMKNKEGEFNATASLNSMGFRGKEFSSEKPADTFRILTIGDSMTFGWGVWDDETYPFFLEKDLKSTSSAKIEVINAGYKGGLSLDGFYLYLKNEGLKLKPDIILLNFFLFNDLNDLADTNWLKIDSQGLPEKIDSCCHVVDERILRNKVTQFKYSYPLLRQSHLFLYLSDLLIYRFKLFPEKNLIVTPGEELFGCALNPDCLYHLYPQFEKAVLLIKEMNEISQKTGAKFIVVLLPVDLQVYQESWGKYERIGMKWYPKKGREDFLNSEIFSRLTKENIPVFDLYPKFLEYISRNGPYPFYPIDAHFNKDGTALVASEVANYLKSSGLVK